MSCLFTLNKWKLGTKVGRTSRTLQYGIYASRVNIERYLQKQQILVNLPQVIYQHEFRTMNNKTNYKYY